MADRIVTIGASGKMYTTPSLAIAGESNFQTGEDNIIFEFDSGQYEIFVLNTKYTTSAAHRIIFRPSAGVHHYFTRSTGVRFVSSSAYSRVIIEIGYTDLDTLAFSNTASGSYEAYGLRHNATGCNIRNCLFYNCNTAGIQMNGGSNNIINSVFLSCNEGLYNNNTGCTINVYNCVSLNSVNYGFTVYSYSTMNLKNCYSGGSGSGDYRAEANSAVNITTCRSSDGSLSTPVVSVAGCSFLNSSAGSEDIHIGPESSLIGIGTDLSLDTVYPFNYDGIGTSRPQGAGWDIGAVEYTESGGSSLPTIINNYRQQGVM